jgi:preprotein translocase subunit YajC
MRGFIYSVCLAVLYALLILFFTSESNIIIQALVRVAIFIGIAGVVTFLSTQRKRADEERKRLILELQETLDKVRMLSGLLPICASCKRIRNDKGYWEQIEIYIRDHSEAEFTHGICPECREKLYPELYKKK